MLCPVGLYLPSNQCFPVVQTAFQQCDRNWRNCVPFYNVHLSCASQTSWACAVLVYSMSSCCPHVPCAKMPPSSPSPADVLLPASHTSCVWPNFILHPVGAFLSISPICQDKSGLSSATLLPCLGDGVWWPCTKASSALGQQGDRAEFFQLIYMCVCTHWAGLTNPAFICRLTSAKLRVSSIHSFRICVCEFPSLLGFPLLTEESILVIYLFIFKIIFKF